jgi:dynein intermediate chain
VYCVQTLVVLTYALQYPELTVASYNKNPAALNEPDGIVAIWNLHMLERPEFVFHSQVSAISPIIYMHHVDPFEVV